MTKCAGCQNGEPLGFDFQMAFQPIINLDTNDVWGYEALVRGEHGESAGSVLAQVTESNRYKFDQACRVKAIHGAAARFDRTDLRLSINFLPNAVYEPSACIRATLEAAREVGFERSRIMFEFTENEQIQDTQHIKRIVDAYREFGFITALDDFGAGYAGLSLLARIQPDVIKIDMDLVRGIESSPPRRAILRGLMAIASDLGVTVLAEGVETRAEFQTIADMGVRLFQGYLFGRPSLEALTSVLQAA